VHYLDYLDTVLGPLTPVSYTDDARGGCEASLSYELRAGDVSVNVQVSRLESNGTYVRFDCERGDIRVEKKNEQEIFVTPAGRPTRRVAIESPFAVATWPKDFHGSFCAMLQQFEEAARGGETQLADAVDAERTAALIEWAYDARSAQSSNMRGAERVPQPEILVTGATGFIGGHLVDRLAEEGRGIRAAARSTATCANIARYPLEIAPVDLMKKEEVETAVRGVRTVFHLAYGRDRANAAVATIEGTKNIVEAAIAAGVESVVVLSTMYVFGFPSGQATVDESFPYRPYGGEYGESKASMERWCLERAKTSGKTRIVILNPTCVFGPGGTAYTRLPVQLARHGQFCWIEGGTGLCNFTYVENVVDAMLAAAKIMDAHGQRFIVSDGALTWRDFLEPLVAPLGLDVPNYSAGEFKSLPRLSRPFRIKDLIFAVLGSREFRDVAKRSRIVRKALASLGDERRARFARASGPPSEPVWTEAKAEKALPPEWLLDLYPPVATTFSADKARRILGWQPATRYEIARDKTLQWLIEAGYYAQPIG
jgi:nucleoside-diphosphate-sugar epimerase